MKRAIKWVAAMATRVVPIITERKRAEETLRASEERFRTLMQFSFDVYWETDAQHRFIRQDFSERVTDGPLPGSELGKRRWELPYLDIDDEGWRKHREMLDAHLPFRDLEYGRPTPNGGKRYAAVSGLPMFDEAGRFIGYRGVGRHITDRKQMEEALRQREKELRDLLETIPAMTVTVLPDGSDVYIGKRFVEYSGLSADKARRSGWKATIHPDDLDQHVSKWRSSLATGEPIEIETRFRRGDGEYRWFLARAVPLRDDQGNILKWYEVLTDIEDRKQAEAALRESEQRFRDYAEIASDWLWETGPDHGFTKFSDQHPFSDYLGKTRWELAADREEEPEKWREHTAILEAHRPFRGFRYRSLRPDGTELHVSVSGKPVFDAKGEFVGYRGVTTDLTAEVRGVEALRSSEDQWKAVFENNPVMYFMVDASGTILSVNPFGADQLGYDVDELVGRPVRMVFHEADRGTVQTFATTCFERPGQAMSWELRKVRKNGEVLWVRETARASVINKRSVLLIVCEDITEGKHAVEALREMQTELAHANRVTTMGQLTASIAHEVNQPIAAAHNNASAALNFLDARPPDLEEVREALRCIVNDTNRAGDVIGHIRALFRKAPIVAETFDMNEAIRDVIIVVRAEATKNGILVEEHLMADLPHINGDRIQLQQVMLNLIINAIEAMSGVDGRARELLIKTAKLGSDLVSVSVRDSGLGLDPANLNRAFDAFYTTKPGGLGMGLSICRSIVETHGGQLTVDANVPHGALFQFTLPARRRRED
ncbi:MAG TPA: PAS domain S-box protein [Bradyrhizobium sp.]|nr:PAS domain S-box protein [Bradyrhizobium sp.]